MSPSVTSLPSDVRPCPLDATSAQLSAAQQTAVDGINQAAADPAAAAALFPDNGGILGRGLHSSAFQLNLSHI